VSPQPWREIDAHGLPNAFTTRYGQKFQNADLLTWRLSVKCRSS